MQNVIIGNFPHNFSENQILTKVLTHNQITHCFEEHKKLLNDKLTRCNGGSPGKGFLSCFMAQQRRYNFKLIKGVDDETQK